MRAYQASTTLLLTKQSEKTNGGESGASVCVGVCVCVYCEGGGEGMLGAEMTFVHVHMHWRLPHQPAIECRGVSRIQKGVCRP